MRLNLFKNFNITDVALLFFLTKFRIRFLSFKGPVKVRANSSVFFRKIKRQKQTFADVLQNWCS